MVLQVQTMTPGDGYRYFESQTVSGDQKRSAGCTLSEYQLGAGLPAGVWVGRAAALLGVAGEVTEAQLRALFGEGLHPRAEEITAEEIRTGSSADAAVAAAQLGTAFYRFGATPTPLVASLEERVAEQQARSGRALDEVERNRIRLEVGEEAFRARFGRGPTDSRALERFIRSESVPKRQPVAGFHAVLQPPPSVTLLWALGSEKVRAIVEAAHDAAVSDTLAWVEDSALATRSGRNGIVQEQVTAGLVGVRFRHFDSRAGDPGLHDHVLIANRVLRADGKWRAIDARHLLAQMVTASELYNAQVLHRVCVGLDAVTVERPRADGLRPVMEIDGVDERLLEFTARRSVAIGQRLVRLLEVFRARHGREPSSVVRTRLRRQATLETRPAKKAARPLPVLRARWRAGVVAAFGRVLVNGLLAEVSAATQRLAARGGLGARLEVPAVASAVVKAVGTHRAVFGPRHIRAEVYRQITRTSHGRADPARWAEHITRFALERLCVELSAPASSPPFAPLQRPDGSSIYRDQETRLYSTPAVLAAEKQILKAARTTVAPPCPVKHFEKHRLRHKGKLDDSQAALARAFASGTRQLIAAIGPAGAGKTSALLLAAKAVRAEGRRVIALAPSARAAAVLGEALGQSADTIQRWVRLTNAPLQRGDVIIVDEAGMASTLDLAAVVKRARDAGAHVRLVGDPAQLAAVEAGGILRLLQAEGHAVHLTQVHRFATAGEADASLLLRDGAPQEAFRWYREHGRIHSGDEDSVLDAAFTAWWQDRGAGRSTILAAPTRTLVKALNLRAQQAVLATGRLSVGPRDARLHDGTRAHVGDTIVTRLNQRRLTCLSGRDFVKNGDTWTVLGYTSTGAARVRHTRHRGTLTLPSAYLARHTELGYAATIHRTQGMTVDTTHTVLAPFTGREAAYVGATRGRDTNHLYVTRAEGQSLDLALLRIATNSDQVPSALETLKAEQRRSRDILRLAAEYADVARRSEDPRHRAVLRFVRGTADVDLPPVVARAMARADQEGVPPWQVLALACHADPSADASAVARCIDELTATARTARPAPPWNDEQAAVLKALTRTREIEARAALELAGNFPVPVPVTVLGRTHPAWVHRPHGRLPAAELHRTAVQQGRRADSSSSLANKTAAKRLGNALELERQLRTFMDRRDRLQEDAQRNAVQRLYIAPSSRQLRRALYAAGEEKRQSALELHRLAVALRVGRTRHTPAADMDFPPAWLCPPEAISDLFTPDSWRDQLLHRRAEMSRLLTARGSALAASPPAWTRHLGTPPGPADGPERHARWQKVAALADTWRALHHLTDDGTVNPLGPAPADPASRADWEELHRALRACAEPDDHDRSPAPATSKPPAGRTSASLRKPAPRPGPQPHQRPRQHRGRRP